MSTRDTLRMMFKASDGANIAIAYDHANTSATAQQVKALMDAIIANKEIFSQQPQTALGAEMLCRERMTIDIGGPGPAPADPQMSLDDGEEHGQDLAAYWGGVMMPHGVIAFAPCNANYVGLAENGGGSFEVKHAVNQPDPKYLGAVLCPPQHENIVVFIPCNADQMLTVYGEGEYNYMGPDHNSGDFAFFGGVYLEYWYEPDPVNEPGEGWDEGRVVMVPFNASAIAAFDQGAYEFEVGADHGEGQMAFSGGVRIDKSKALLVPYDSEYIGIYDLATDEYTRGPAHVISSNAFMGGVRHEDFVYLIPYNSPRIGIYNITTNQYTDGPEHDCGDAAFVGGAVMGGYLVMSPYSATHVGVMEISSRRFIKGPENAVKEAYTGVIPDLMGNSATFVPYNATHIGRFTIMPGG